MRHMIATLIAATCYLIGSVALPDDSLPFEIQVQTFRDQDDKVAVFSLKLEQPFLAGEFVQNKHVSLQPKQPSAWLVYPRETQFEQKHAEFHGRLRIDQLDKESGSFTLMYDVVSENPDGTRSVEVKEAEIIVELPLEDGGSENLVKDWARRQNEHFAELLRYYPDNSFLQYVLLQSADRYGIEPPDLPKDRASRKQNDRSLYHLFSSGLAIQKSLQWEVLTYGPRIGDRTVHISNLSPPEVRTLNYQQRLEHLKEAGKEPQRQEIAQRVPADQYLFHVRDFDTAGELLQLTQQWGGSLLRLFDVTARDHHLRERYFKQLTVDSQGLSKLFESEAVSEVVVTGSDFSFQSGTDITLILKMNQPHAVRNAVSTWLAEAKQNHSLIEREFNYRGYQVAARYTNDRQISSLVVFDGDYAMVSNSHRAIRKVLDTSLGELESLYQQIDYQYMTALLPPQAGQQHAYFYGSEAFLKRLFSPEFKIAEKRRLQAFNNLIMLNNASMFYRLEHGSSPADLDQLSNNNFVNMTKIVDPSGGAYSYDTERDTATSSVYNRVKYLTPITELDVLEVSKNEQNEYQQFKDRYEDLWSGYFDPIAIRVEVGTTVRLETAVVPFAEESEYENLQQMLAPKPLALDTANFADTAVVSLAATPGKKLIGNWLRELPGMEEALKADPTLTDLSWLGDRVSFHYCDDDMILEIDPTQFRKLNVPGFSLDPSYQAGIAAAVSAISLPTYLTIEVQDEQKAERLLDLLRSRIFLESGDTIGFVQSRLDAYRVPAYKDHPIYVATYQLYALKLRLHVALVGGKLIVATEEETLEQVIDAAEVDPQPNPAVAHGLFQIDFAAMEKIKADLHRYWAEKARRAAHDNIMPLYMLIKLYDVDIEQANVIADAKYGVTYFDPGGGSYQYDAQRDQVFSTVFGNRRNARQDVTLEDSPLAEWFDRIDNLTASIRFEGDVLMATVEIVRSRQE